MYLWPLILQRILFIYLFIYFFWGGVSILALFLATYKCTGWSQLVICLDVAESAQVTYIGPWGHFFPFHSRISTFGNISDFAIFYWLTYMLISTWQKKKFTDCQELYRPVLPNYQNFVIMLKLDKIWKVVPWNCCTKFPLRSTMARSPDN